MLSGELYDSRDPELLRIYHQARKLLKQYRDLDSDQADKRNDILEELLGHKGAGVWIEAPFFCDFGENISIGENSFINMNCVFLDGNKISIGKNALIAPNVQIYTATHPLKASERIVEDGDSARYLTSTKPVKIGDNVWIGGGSIILPGVSIGDNVTIAAGSVVNKDIPDDSLVVGNPAVVKRKLI